jgi:hypothetical protein
MIEKFAIMSGLGRSEFLDLNHTSQGIAIGTAGTDRIGQPRCMTRLVVVR